MNDLIADGRLGPLAVSVSTIAPAALSNDQREGSRIDPNDETTEAVNAVRGGFGINFPAGTYTLGNLTDAFSGIDVTAEFVGSLHLHVDTGLNTAAQGMPTIVADLHVNFDAATSLGEITNSIANPRFSITDAGLDLGTFVADVIAPILEPVQDFLKPLQPTIDRLTTPIPVLSEIIGPTTFIDLIGSFGEGGESAAEFINAILAVNDAIVSLPLTADGLILPLGNFSIQQDAHGNAVTSPLGGGIGASLDDFLNDADEAIGEAADYLRDLPRSGPSGSTSSGISSEPGKFSFPILQNPAQAIGLLFGNDVDLVKFQAPTLDAEFSFNIGVPVFPGFEITFGGQFNAIIDFAFGYDTAGIRQFADTGRARDLLNGFYLDDYRQVGVDANDEPIYAERPELTFAFAVTAGGEIDLKAAKAGVQAELGAQLLLDLNDPNGDTKVRLNELEANIQLGNAPALGPLWIFDASGQLTAALTAYAKAFGIRVSARLGPKVLVNYDFPRPEPANIVLARKTSDGELILHIGPEAGARVEGDTSDGDETIFVEYDHETGKTLVTGFGKTDEFTGVTRVRAHGGNGEDTIIMDASLTVPVEIDGGYGDDDIELGGGTSLVRGGWGDDVITGGDADDRIFGQGTADPQIRTAIGPLGPITLVATDRDLILGGGGNDIIDGGADDDNLKGDGGQDRIVGGTGDDFINGGDDNDILIGLTGNDVLSGDGGDDLLYGDFETVSGETGMGVEQAPGLDVLLGGAGADVLYAGPGNDELFGGLGPDQLFGGAGDDLMVGAVTSRDDPNFESIQSALDVQIHFFSGGRGNDLIYGTAGVDTVEDTSGRNRIFTYEGDDNVTTGNMNDLIRTGSGNDVVADAGGVNEIYTGAGFDIVDSGAGSDLIDLRGDGFGLTLSGTGGSQVTDLGGSNIIFGDFGDDIIDVLGSGMNQINAGDGENRVTTLGTGGDTIRTGRGNDFVSAGDGNNEITVGGGNDTVLTGGGDDHVYLGSGDDTATTGAGNDLVIAGSGNDFVDAQSGSDVVHGGEGDDELVGGIGSDTLRGDAGSDVVWGGLRIYQRSELLASLVTPLEYDPLQSVLAFPTLVPAITVNGPIEGSLEDGNDLITGGEGRDFLFGGGGRDKVIGGGGESYIDGGRGDDILVGTAGSDVIRGGLGDDDIDAGAGIDFSYGDGGNDFLLGGAGISLAGTHETFGQRAYGGSGDDVLWAYAATDNSTIESLLRGEFLDGGEGRDELLGNLRQDTLLGGGGDDRLLGDALAGPAYLSNDDFKTTGGGDLIIGGLGDDLLQGGGGNDVLWGGGNVDELEGHAGEDRLYGGGGRDFLRLDVAPEYAGGGDILDGHFGNAPDDLAPDDFATDILIVNGTAADDTITIGGDGAGQAIVTYNGRQLPITIKDSGGNTLVEQYQINGLSGNDVIEFLPTFDTSDLADRGRDFVAVFQGGSGDDTLTGSSGRDRLDGGRGSDLLYGLGGDDQLFGDSGEGSSSDEDRLFAGTGNDDLLGGLGVNYLYAWTSDPTAGGVNESGPAYGVFNNDGQREDTGLNRMLGRDQDDFLFAGTGLDFLYGGAGQDSLYDVDGQLLENFGVPEGEEWLAYARSNDSVWYYGGTGRDDIISVDFVTEPGLLGNHHLITRLTQNNGFFSFDAQVRLDFAATNADGTLVWDPSTVVTRVEQLRGAADDEAQRLAAAALQKYGKLLPPEGDFTAIVVNAGDGDDQVYVGPTVQRTVWVAAGRGDDRVEIQSGKAILTDLADADPRNEVLGDPDDFSAAYDLGRIADSIYFEKLTLDGPDDVDWFTFTTDAMRFAADSRFVIDSIGEQDGLTFELFEYDAGDEANLLLADGTLSDTLASLDLGRRFRTQLSIEDQSFSDGQRFYMRVRSNNASPTSYNLGIDLAGESPLGGARQNLGVESDTFLRRDVIVDGDGDDILRGGPSEDWVIGGDGNDILTGGVDGDAGDILIGGAGDDVFQVIPSAATPGFPFSTTLADHFDGGPGYDRVLFQGGDVDDRGRVVPDHVTLRYQPMLNVYELAAKVWDTANQSFLVDGNAFVIDTASYRTRDIEATQFDTRGGDDEVHLEEASLSIVENADGSTSTDHVSGYQFDRPDGTSDPRETYGIAPGDRQAGGSATNFIVHGGAGNDRLFGSPYGDTMFGGAGIDQIIGGGGRDQIDGGSGDDLIIGDGVQANTTLLDNFEFSAIGRSNQTPLGATRIDLSSGALAGLTLHEGDAADWYVLSRPADGSVLDSSQVSITFDDNVYQQMYANGGAARAEVYPAVLDPSTGTYVLTDGPATAYLAAVINPTGSAIVAADRPGVDQLPGGQTANIDFKIAFGGGVFPRTVRLKVSAAESGQSIADRLSEALQDAGIEDNVRAFYDSIRDRLILKSLNEGALTLSQETFFNLPCLGFVDGQTSGGSPIGLGQYTLSTDVALEPIATAGPIPATKVYEYATAARAAFDAPRPSFVLDDRDADLRGAWIAEGADSHDALSRVVPIGDVNGDGRQDLIFESENHAYVVLGDIDLHASIHDVRDVADYVIDLSSTSGDFRVIDGIVDLDGDGKDDPTFAFINDSGPVGSVTVYALSGATLTGRDLAEVAFGLDPREFPLTNFATRIERMDFRGFAEDVDLGWIEQNEDEYPDLAIFSRQPVMLINGNGIDFGYGVVKDGEDLRGFFTGPFNSGAANLVSVTDSKERGNNNVGPAQFQASVTQIGGTDEVHATFGDLDGDGLDDVILTMPRGWEFAPDELTSVSRTYRIAGGTSALNVDLGSTTAPAIAQFAELAFSIRTDGDGVAENTGALNVDQPVFAGDIDADGFDDLVFVSDVSNGDNFRRGLARVYRGQTLLEPSTRLVNPAPDVRFEVDNKYFRVIVDPSISIGDFDGDSVNDLAFGRPTQSGRSVTVFFDALADMSQRSASTVFGDSRVDAVVIDSPIGGVRFGSMPVSPIDLNGDRIADLIIGAGSVSTSTGMINGGAVHAIAGLPRVLGLPDEDAITDLANDSIRGLGDIVRDSQGDIVVQSSLASDALTDWYRFRTTGDGRFGDRLTLTDSINTPRVTIDRGSSGIISGNTGFDNVPEVVVHDDQTGVLEFDVSALLAEFDDPARISGAQLRLTGWSKARPPRRRNP